MKKTIICIIGPTAVGKTEVALKLAKKINAEIISCDSMQVYKGIDIATAKPTKKQRTARPHYFIDIIRPSQEYNAARFRNDCLKIISDIYKRGRIAMIVAGTGLYLRALLDGLFAGPGQNKQLRQRFQQEVQEQGLSYLYSRLKEVDPEAAKGIHPHDERRIIRALEVYMLTARPISEWRSKTRGIRDKYEVYLFGLNRAREQLYARIDNRVERMFKQGLVAEMARIAKGRISKTAKSVLGYKEIMGLLKGEYPQEQAKRLLKQNTRHYAKRQLTWFGREKGVKWIELGPRDTARAVAEKILRDVGDRQG